VNFKAHSKHQCFGSVYVFGPAFNLRLDTDPDLEQVRYKKA
jgi:hypothetical protein